jgi:hypothetical protein
MQDCLFGKHLFIVDLQDEGLSTMQDRTGQRKGDGRDDNRVQDMEEESSDEDGDDKNQPQIQPPLPPIPDKVVVKKYDPKQGEENILLSAERNNCFCFHSRKSYSTDCR